MNGVADCGDESGILVCIDFAAEAMMEVLHLFIARNRNTFIRLWECEGSISWGEQILRACLKRGYMGDRCKEMADNEVMVECFPNESECSVRA